MAKPLHAVSVTSPTMAPKLLWAHEVELVDSFLTGIFGVKPLKPYDQWQLQKKLVAMLCVNWPDEVLADLSVQVIMPIKMQTACEKIVCALRDIQLDRTQKCSEWMKGKSVQDIIAHVQQRMKEINRAY